MLEKALNSIAKIYNYKDKFNKAYTIEIPTKIVIQCLFTVFILNFKLFFDHQIGKIFFMFNMVYIWYTWPKIVM